MYGEAREICHCLFPVNINFRITIVIVTNKDLSVVSPLLIIFWLLGHVTCVLGYLVMCHNDMCYECLVDLGSMLS